MATAKAMISRQKHVDKYTDSQSNQNGTVADYGNLLLLKLNYLDPSTPIIFNC